jgi:hypothetical protein
LGGILQFKVPQNIDMQDRILGPLTMIQFVYAVVGFGTCYAIFMSTPKPLSYLLITPIAFFVICLDFVKVNERPFLDFFVAAMEYLAVPKKRFWHQNLGSSDLEIEIYHINQNAEKPVAHKEISHNQIEELAQKIDNFDQSQLIKK